MPAKSPITNDEIKSKPYSSSYSDGWERCFLKKPQEWLDLLYAGIHIKSPDGFRWNDGTTWETPIRKEEFERRLQHCTIISEIENLIDEK